jgi:phytanoyl-CoA hydroxylase
MMQRLVSYFLLVSFSLLCFEENGCMFAVPGSHHEDPVWFFRRTASGAAAWDADHDGGAALGRAGPLRALEAASGTLVALHGNLTHRSAANTSLLPRAAFTMHITEAALEWRPDNWLQRPKEGFRKWD